MVSEHKQLVSKLKVCTIPADASGGRRNLSHGHSAQVTGGQKIDVEKFDGKINFSTCMREVMDALIPIDLDVVLKNKKHKNLT